MRPSTAESIAAKKVIREVRDMQLGFRFHADRFRHAGMFWVWLDDLADTLEYPVYRINETTENFLSSEPYWTDRESYKFNMEV